MLQLTLSGFVCFLHSVNSGPVRTFSPSIRQTVPALICIYILSPVNTEWSILHIPTTARILYLASGHVIHGNKWTFVTIFMLFLWPALMFKLLNYKFVWNTLLYPEKHEPRLFKNSELMATGGQNGGWQANHSQRGHATW